MRIAVVTDDGKTISRHFGQGTRYLVFTIEDGKVTDKMLREKPKHAHHHSAHGHDHHGHGMDPSTVDDDHAEMIAPIHDCAAVIAHHMGHGSFGALERQNIVAILTDVLDIKAAVDAYLSGTLVNHQEWVH